MNSIINFETWETLDKETRRGKLLEFQKMCGEIEQEVGQVQFGLREWFVNGVYAREITMPTNSIVVGKIHKTEHVSIVSKGRALVATEDGLEEIDASEKPHTFINKIGAKRCLLILEEMVWTTIHPTDKLTAEEVEKDIIAPTYESIGLEVNHELVGIRNISSSLLSGGCS